jgi:MscS family membrane protein
LQEVLMLPFDLDHNVVHQANRFFWVWIYPLLVVGLAGLTAGWAGTHVPDRDDDKDGRPDLGPMLLRSLLQAVVFGVSLAGGVWLDRRLHGEPEYLGLLAKTVSLILFLWLSFRVVETAFRFARSRFLAQGRAAAATVLPLLQKLSKVGLLLLAAILYLDNLGVNVSALLAGLGVGGLAVALAGQRTVENLFGGMVLILDQPVRVGDFFRYGDKLGTVEDIGLRSVKIRTLDRTLVSIPNGNFSQMELENFAARDKIRLSTTLGLRYETTAAQLETVIRELRQALLAHPKVDPDPARVRFTRFGAYSLDVEILAYVKTSDFNEFLEVQQELFLRFMRVVEDAGTGFAFPSQTLYLGRDAGLPQIKRV